MRDGANLIGGVEYTDLSQMPRQPLWVVEAAEKSGKSTLSTTLFDFPEEGDRPLVIAFDSDGPQSCAQIGYSVPHVKVKDQEQHGADPYAKTRGVVENLKDVYLNKGKRPYSTIVVDCASTQAEWYYGFLTGYKDGRQRYGKVLDWCRETMNDLITLGVPIIYYCWVREAHIEETKDEGGAKGKKIVMGGPQIAGSFKGVLAGRCNMLFYMKKAPATKNDPWLCRDGFKRSFYTKNTDLIEAGGRWLCPNPMQAHLGAALAMYYGMIPNPAQADRSEMIR